MFKYKVKIKMITYEGTKWLSTNVFAESTEQCFKKVEQDYRLYDCMDYYVHMKEMAAE